MTDLHPTLLAVTQRITERSAATRVEYLATMQRNKANGGRRSMACGNLAHAVAASPETDKRLQIKVETRNIGIVTAYNDMLSAHQPFEHYPQLIKQTARALGATAQVAGGVPAMCDGVTQGQPGMELSLFSRDVIAMSAAIALSHNVFDAAVFLGVCDKIVPGLVIAAATFGHLPIVFLPAGPMVSGISNDEKAKTRQLYAAGKVGRDELLASEMKSYHAAGTCTFYGTANTNQMLMEFMGLQLPGSSFINPYTPLRDALTKAGTAQAVKLANSGVTTADILDVKAFVNGMVGLNATGGSTNLLLHLVAMARATGVIITLEDFADISKITPLIARVYPNGAADVNHFHAAGGLQFMIRQLLQGGLLHNDVQTIVGKGLEAYTQEAFLNDVGEVVWREGTATSHNLDVVRPITEPFQPTGGLQRLQGNIGEAVIKVSAVKPERHVIQAPARVFSDQEEVKAAFERGELDRDVVCVVRFQGAKSNGMPELHSLTPVLGIVQERGYQVALVTDGRMSGASGKVPAAIHVSPEALDRGMIACIQDGDLIRLDANAGTLEVLNVDLSTRTPATLPTMQHQSGLGRELFGAFRSVVSPASQGASVLFHTNS